MPAVPLTAIEIADDLADRITRGEYPSGSKLPTHRELAAIYSISMSTAQRAVLLLRDRGVIVGVRGRGLFVP